MMKRYLTLVFTAILLLSPTAYGQEGFSYQLTMIGNPALTGSAGNGMLRMSYMNHYPGNGYNLHSVFVSYDGFFPVLHGGAGFYISDEYPGGIITNLKGGFSYSYFLRASQDLYINAGLSASFYHRGYNFSGALLPDQIDPLLGGIYPSSEVLAAEGRTVFDLTSGFLVIYRGFSGGFSVKHLTQPDPSNHDDAGTSLARTLLVHASLEVSTRGKLRFYPAMMAETGDDIFSAGAGVSAKRENFSIDAFVLGGGDRNIDLQTGFSFSAANIKLFYSYRFNIFSGETLMPFSLLHHTGLVFSLYNVDKRKIIKTINFPDL
ncbi:MAG: PorP/SprF family type IX secretion system membrane protein [Bacteroidales bacterium]|nr:PorP/SprF family type IX secretion system membrane protein [Bacteroidales bacterium]